MNKKQPEKVNERWRAPDSVTIIQPDNATNDDLKLAWWGRLHNVNENPI